MKQKVVIKVAMNENKSRSKAMKIAVGVSGVESVGLRGQDKNQIEVTGDGIDAVELTMLLRKNVGIAELVSVSPVGGKSESTDTKKNEPPRVQPVVLSYGHGAPPYQMYELGNNYQDRDPSCSIM